MPGKRLSIAEHDPMWAAQFVALGAELREVLGAEAVRIDHIGSTAVAGLAAKAVIDVQVTVEDLSIPDAWSDELLPGLQRLSENNRDHIPAGLDADVGQWTKRMWSRRQHAHVHVRAHGHLNQQYALLFRDYLRADAVARGAYEALKRALSARAPDDWDTYYAVKDPACDLIIAGAEHWAKAVAWSPGRSDA